MYHILEGKENMISPINFKADAGQVTISKPVEVETQKPETVTVPAESVASFKGANALAAYNKALLNTEGEAEEKAPAFKGAEESPEEKAPSFKGEAETEETKDAPAFRGEDSETTANVPAFKAEEQEAETEEKETK